MRPKLSFIDGDNRSTMKKILSLFLLVVLHASTWAQFRVEVSGVGLTQIPVAVSAFRGEDTAVQKISAIVQADLERSGQFRGVDASGVNLDEASRLKSEADAAIPPEPRWDEI